MSFWKIFKEYCKRVRQFYGLQKQDNSQSLEGRREANIFPINNDKKQKLSEPSNVKTIDIKPIIKNIERK